jgi:hypothetical protein
LPAFETVARRCNAVGALGPRAARTDRKAGPPANDRRKCCSGNA